MVNKIGNQAVMDAPYIRSLKHLGRFLKPEGKFLLATDNLYSLSNCQNGVSLNPWNHNRILHKAQIEGILEKSGFPFYQFLYPLPDYRTVGRVYSDKALPTAAEWNCLSNMECGDQNFLSHNMDLLTRLTDNGMFGDMAPSFFIEACREDALSSIGSMGSVNVLVDGNEEIPAMGFDWGAHGKSFLGEAIDKYRQKDEKPFYDRAGLRAAAIKVDQDHEELHKVL